MVLVVKNPPGNAGDAGSIPRLGRSPEEGHGNPQQFMPGKSYGQRSLVGYSPWGHKESDTSEVTLHAHVHTPQGGVWGLWFASFLPLEVQRSHMTFIDCQEHADALHEVCDLEMQS